MRPVLIIYLVLYITLASAVQWNDCGIPLTRKIYYEGVVVDPSTINVATASASSISVNIASQIKDYTLKTNTTVNLEVLKDGETYFDGTVGELCQILYNANGASCPLVASPYSFTFKYALPPLPTGNYTITITTYDDTGAQIGCLSVRSFVMGLGLDACSYNSSLSAEFVGTAQFLNDNTVIQIGPWGPNGEDLGYAWGTFKTISASVDLVGYNLKAENYVWGITGSINKSVSLNQFDGTLVLGYRPDVSNYKNAQLVYQGSFSWIMTPSTDPTSPAYIFERGTFDFEPTYFFPNDFPYPLTLGNLGSLAISSSSQGSAFKVSVSKKWCRCNCAQGGLGADDSFGNKNGNTGANGMSGFQKGTIAVCVIGGLALIALIVVIIRVRRTRPRPVVYDDADLMDPQKPDYGSMAINDALEAEEQEYLA